MSKTERRPRLTAARKFELYLATRLDDAPLGEILRQYGVHLDDLRAIEQVVESSALAGLKAQARHGRQPSDLSPERVQQLEQEVAEKTRALAELVSIFGYDGPPSSPMMGQRKWPICE
jgi:ATP/maltotriose-dependent transcriptional regulator MalT